MNNPLPMTWNQLFVTYSESAWDSLFRFSLSLCKNEIEAEDLVQQTLLKSLQGLPSFFKNNYSALNEEDARIAAERQGAQELREHLLNWMLKICKNTFLDSRNRAHRKLGHFSLDDWQEEDSQGADAAQSETLAETSSKSLGDAERAFFEQALDDAWKERFDQLNARQRSIIYLAAEDYSYKEIAHLLEIPIGTVMSTLSRTLSKLKKSAQS